MNFQNLRDYQQEGVGSIRKAIKDGKRRIMFSSPTGSGKTIVFTYLSKSATENNNRVLILTHRKELLRQSSGAFTKFDINAHSLTAETKYVPNGKIVVGMVETLYRRLENKTEYAKLIDGAVIIIDEAHIGQFDKLFKHFAGAKLILGFSATPYRRNPQTPLSKFYDAIVHGPTVAQLIKNGWLSKAFVFGQRVDMSQIGLRSGEYKAEDQETAFEAQGLYGSFVKQWQKLVPGKKTLTFAPSVASSIEVMNRFNQAGVPAAHVDATTPKAERAEIFEEFKHGEIMFLTNQGITNLGFDEPTIDVVALFRATRSLTLYLQMIGRGSRIIEGLKDSFTVLDFGNNSSRFGFYEDEREWSLDNDTTTFKKETTMTKICPACEAIVRIGIIECPNCGYIWTQARRIQMTEIIELELEPLNGFAIQEYAHGKSFEELEVIQEALHYKKQWIYHQLQTEQDLRMYGEFMKYNPGWIKHALKSFVPKTLEERKAEYEDWFNNKQ